MRALRSTRATVRRNRSSCIATTACSSKPHAKGRRQIFKGTIATVSSIGLLSTTASAQESAIAYESADASAADGGAGADDASNPLIARLLRQSEQNKVIHLYVALLDTTIVDIQNGALTDSDEVNVFAQVKCECSLLCPCFAGDQPCEDRE